MKKSDRCPKNVVGMRNEDRKRVRFDWRGRRVERRWRGWERREEVVATVIAFCTGKVQSPPHRKRFGDGLEFNPSQHHPSPNLGKEIL